MALGHFLQDLDEKADLNLGRLLEQSIQSGGPLSLAQHLEPLLNCAQLVFKILIQGRSRHFLQRDLVLVNVRNPLPCGLVHSFVGEILILALSRLIVVDLGRWPDISARKR